MHMKYYKVAQPVPGKGEAFTYYECDDNYGILRQLTYVPLTGEITRVPDPIVKKLYRPEWCTEIEAQEFLTLWGNS
jgi:hypothetical protein